MALIYDRTAADVAAMNDKGTYQAADLNRVTEAISELADALAEEGIETGVTWLRTSWSATRIPTPEELENYLDNVRRIRAALPNAAPAAPTSMRGLTYEGANNIERIIYDIEQLLAGMIAIYPRSGLWPSGAVKGVIQT